MLSYIDMCIESLSIRGLWPPAHVCQSAYESIGALGLRNWLGAQCSSGCYIGNASLDAIDETKIQ